ncbi:MAG: glutamyl-tRNA reductase [Pseudomonadota bacterium]|nr:glutamyl-tRNA reductase [Pseudomonadota bacterium]
MNVVALGLNHHTAPLDLRGRFAFPGDQLVPKLRAFSGGLQRACEVAIVSTCNRTELYLGSAANDTLDLAGEALGWLAETGGITTGDLQAHTYVHENADAARHTFRLASGLNSMVVGETQILGQMKRAVQGADTAGTLGTTLQHLFQRSFAVAKEVRSGTEIGMHTVSLGAAIARLASNLFEDFGALRVLFLGAGEMAAPVLAHLAAKGPRQITIANRGVERREALAAQFNAESVGLVQAMARLAEFDVVVSCTASSLPLVGLGAVQRAIKSRKCRPILMVDLAVPRDIEAEVGMLSDVYLYTLDDLAKIVQGGGDRRLAAVGQAEQIIESGVQDFVRWLDMRQTVPLIQALQSQAESWRNAELQRARKLLARGEDVEAVLEAMSRGLTQKMLHGPMAGLQATCGAERTALTDTLSRLFLRCPMRPPGAN